MIPAHYNYTPVPLSSVTRLGAMLEPSNVIAFTAEAGGWLPATSVGQPSAKGKNKIMSSVP